MQIYKLISFLLLIFKVVASNYTYTAKDYLLINCANPSSSAPDSYFRNWTSDYPFASTKKSLTKEIQAPDAIADPYTTARVFNHAFTYNISISPGRIFLRLHFYAGLYLNCDIKKAVFSVSVNGNVLLNNVSVYEITQADNHPYLIKEYSVFVQKPPLKLTFTPSTTTFAFINGIEVVSMPNDLYKIPNSPANLTILELMLRLNVGGKYIAPTNDTGFFRSWWEEKDHSVGLTGLPTSNDKNVTITFPNNRASYLAPVKLYASFREMTPDKRVNFVNNLTWRVSVDIGFNYMVRMHFCEIDTLVNKKNQVVFDIYINDRTVKSGVDIIQLAGGVGIPYVLEFLVNASDTEMISVALHPNMSSKPRFCNSRLNGLEILKVNSQGNVVKLNPTSTDESKRSYNRALVIGVIVGVVTLFVAVGIVVFFVCPFHTNGEESATEWASVDTYNTPSINSSNSSTTAAAIVSKVCRNFSFQEIRTATREFDKSLLLGSGGFGQVYKGELEIDGGMMTVAIKRGSSLNGQGIREFRTEIELLSKLRHRNLVSLLGYCEDNREMILVYEYMAFGTLRQHLQRTQKPPLPWIRRLNICIESARGLQYLHTSTENSIIHRDVKSTNILLDEKMVAKVSDVGLSKRLPVLDATHVSTAVRGSYGYFDPEYLYTGKLTHKSDVYSFGVVLMEVLCGRSALEGSLPEEQVSLDAWARTCYKRGNLDTIVDPCVKAEATPKCYRMFVETAISCLSETSSGRPSMGDLLQELELELKMQENLEESATDVMTTFRGKNIFSDESDSQS